MEQESRAVAGKLRDAVFATVNFDRCGVWQCAGTRQLLISLTGIH